MIETSSFQGTHQKTCLLFHLRAKGIQVSETPCSVVCLEYRTMAKVQNPSNSESSRYLSDGQFCWAENGDAKCVNQKLLSLSPTGHELKSHQLYQSSSWTQPLCVTAKFSMYQHLLQLYCHYIAEAGSKLAWNFSTFTTSGLLMYQREKPLEATDVNLYSVPLSKFSE